MSGFFWFFLGSLVTVAVWFAALWFEQWQENRERVRSAEEQVIELWFGDDCE